MKNKNLKKLISFAMVFVFTLSVIPTTDLKATTSEETSNGAEISSTNQMLHFIMKVRWGNVIDDPTNSEETNFDGSVSVLNSARVSLERTLLFERHNATADKITKRKDPVSWNSLTYGHWDGVKVLISSPANDSVTIQTTQGNITMTAKELYNLSESKVEDVGEGREIVIKAYPIKNPRYFLKVIWGKTSRADYKIRNKEAGDVEINTAVSSSDSNAIIAGNSFRRSTNGIAWNDASGNFEINGGGTLKFIKALRFEGKDEITLSNSNSKIEWISYVAQGVDGILTGLNLDANTLNNSDAVTLNFTKVKNSNGTEGWSKDFNIIDLYHDRKTVEVVGDGYGVILQVWKRPNRSLIRAKTEVYMIEDGVKQWIPSPEVLESQGLSFKDVENVSQDELDTYGTAEEVCYADGTIVKEHDENNPEAYPEVYVIADGEKKHITDPKAFSDLGYDWNNVVKVKPGTLGIYRLRSAMKSNSVHPEGALIREDGTNTVYLIEGGKKKPISTESIFNARRLNWNKVLVIKKAQMAKFQSGANLQYPDGALVKVKDTVGKVYKMDHGEKRWIRSGDDLTGAGYNADDIIEITDAVEITDLEATVEGADIVADDIAGL